jgi:hypothetical protein
VDVNPRALSSSQLCRAGDEIAPGIPRRDQIRHRSGKSGHKLKRSKGKVRPAICRTIGESLKMMTATNKRLRKMSMALGLAISLGALAPSADAHGIWFAQRARQLALVYGVGADDLDAVKRLPLVKETKGLMRKGCRSR